MYYCHSEQSEESQFFKIKMLRNLSMTKEQECHAEPVALKLSR